MYEFFKGDYFRARQMIWGALSSTYLPDVFRLSYENILSIINERQKSGEVGHNEADSIKDIAIAKIKAVDYILKKHGPNNEDAEEVKSFQDIVQKAMDLRDANVRLQKQLYDELMKLCAKEANGGVEAKYYANKLYDEVVVKGNNNVRRPTHIRQSSI